MQTFLPLPSCVDSAAVLDYRRLGKQRVECFQLLAAMGDRWALRVRAAQGKPPLKRNGWTNHPATAMWRGHADALKFYMNVVIDAWIARGYKNNMEKAPLPYQPNMPRWFGEEDFHASHRSNLLRKDPEWYGQFGWTEAADLEYIWPVP